MEDAVRQHGHAEALAVEGHIALQVSGRLAAVSASSQLPLNTLFSVKSMLPGCDHMCDRSWRHLKQDAAEGAHSWTSFEMLGSCLTLWKSLDYLGNFSPAISLVC